MSESPPTPASTHPRPQQERATLRRERVANLIGQGASYRVIAQTLSTSIRTIERDAAAVRERARAEVMTATVAQIAGDAVLSAAARRQALWEIVVADTRSRTRIAALRAIAELERDLLAALQSLGVAYKAPARIDARLEMLAVLDTLSAEQLAQVAATADNESFMRDLTAAVGSDVAERFVATLGGAEVLESKALPSPQHDRAP